MVVRFEDEAAVTSTCLSNQSDPGQREGRVGPAHPELVTPTPSCFSIVAFEVCHSLRLLGFGNLRASPAVME